MNPLYLVAKKRRLSDAERELRGQLRNCVVNARAVKRETKAFTSQTNEKLGDRLNAVSPNRTAAGTRSLVGRRLHFPVHQLSPASGREFDGRAACRLSPHPPTMKSEATLFIYVSRDRGAHFSPQVIYARTSLFVRPHMKCFRIYIKAEYI